MYPVMANGIRTGNPNGINKGRSSKFREGSRVWRTPEQGRRTYRPKRWANVNKDDENSPINLNEKKIQLKISVFLDKVKFKQFYLQQFNLAEVICLHTVSMSDSSIWPRDRTRSGATSPCWSRPESNGNEGWLVYGLLGFMAYQPL